MRSWRGAIARPDTAEQSAAGCSGKKMPEPLVIWRRPMQAQGVRSANGDIMRALRFDIRLPLCGLALGLLAAPLPAAAAAMDQAFKACTAEDTAVADRLKACEATIASGEFKGPKLAMALTHRGAPRASQRDFTRAIADFDEALRLRPDSPLARYYRGAAHVAVRDFDR